MGSLRERECGPKCQWADQTTASDTDEGAGSHRSRSRHPDFQRARIPRFGRSGCGLEDLRAICEVAYFAKSGARRDDSVEKRDRKACATPSDRPREIHAELVCPEKTHETSRCSQFEFPFRADLPGHRKSSFCFFPDRKTKRSG